MTLSPVESAEKNRSMTREEMREALVTSRIMGVEFPIGSDASTDPIDAFTNVVLPRARHTHVVTWIQHPQVGPQESMNQSVYFHPEAGLTLNDRGQVVISAEEAFAAFINNIIAGGITDLSPAAASGYAQLVARRGEIPKGTVAVKSQIASPSCSLSVLPEELQNDYFQEPYYRALVQGHVDQLMRLGLPVVIVSVDDPGSNAEKAQRNLEMMFGDIFQDGRLVSTQEPRVLRAYHDCAGPAGLFLMKSGAVDIIHMDAILLGVSTVLGDDDSLREYISKKGMFALGLVPQTTDGLVPFAHALGIEFDGSKVKSDCDYDQLADQLRLKKGEAATNIADAFIENCARIAQSADMDPRTVVQQSFLSTSCGLGSLKNSNLRAFVYDLLALTTPRIQVYLQ